MTTPEQRFDALLTAMATIPLSEMTAKADQASSAAVSEGSGDTQTPKGKSAATSGKS